MTEIWKDIPSWNGLYMASSLGRVRSTNRTITAISRWGSPQVYRREGIILKLRADRDGYLRCRATQGDRVATLMAHRAVCEAFHGLAPSPTSHAAHGDGIRTNNTPANLRWATAKENFHDRYAHGTAPTGSAHGRSVLNEKMVLEMRDLLVKGEKQSVLAKQFGVCVATVSNIFRRASWGHI